MVIDQGPQPCAYKGCECEVPAGQTYCGPHCANASVEADAGATSRAWTNCNCGHASCNDAAESQGRSNIEREQDGGRREEGQ